MKTLLLALLVFSATPLSAQSNSYVFIFLNKRTDQKELPKEQVDKLMEGHMANINKMAKEGHLLAAGPFEGGGGIFIFNTKSKEDVSEWIKGDPAIQANRWNVEMLLYTPRTGGACLAKEPYEMTMYSFVRYVPNIAKFNVQDAPELFGKHDDYLKTIKKTGNVIAEGTFGENEGGILIMKGEIQAEVIENDPAVREGLLELNRKQLYTAKGAFCEK
jgi:uncharacterized protein YciI